MAEPPLADLFDRHYRRMLRVAEGMLDDRAAAEDVVQEAFLGLHTGWPRIRDRPEAVGYLHRSVVNGCRSRLRRRVVAARVPPPRPPDAISAEDTLLSSLITGPLADALRELPRRQRETVFFRHCLDLSERQTAEVLGLETGSVKAYASRGLARLRATLAESSRFAAG